jgi:precorrin-6B methylase 2
MQRDLLLGLGQTGPGQLLDLVVLGFTLSEFTRTGILPSIARTGSVTRADLSSTYRHDPLFLERAIHLMCAAGILSENHQRYDKGPFFAEYWHYAGPLHWLIHGNSRLLLEGPATEGVSRERLRDYAAIAAAATLAGEELIDPFLAPLWKQLAPGSISDVGCGGASRLIALAKQLPYMTAVGFDRNSEALKVARANVERQELADRIALVLADAETIEQNYPETDLIFSALMMHDLLPKQRAIDALIRWRGTFPNAERMLIVDTCRVDTREADTTFIEPFEYVHALLGIRLVSVAEWTEIFASAGWALNESISTGLPNTFAFVLERVGP